MFLQDDEMKLKVFKTKTESSGVLGGRKFSYVLRIVAELTEDETNLLNKYGYLNNRLIYDPDLIDLIVSKDIKGKSIFDTTLGQLQKGMEWSCDYLPVPFANIPESIKSAVKDLVGSALYREAWGGEEVLEIDGEI